MIAARPWWSRPSSVTWAPAAKAIEAAVDGYTRFDDFQANIGLSSSMLTSRLKTLVDRGILARRPYQDRPVRHEYVLTDLGRSLRPVLVAMAAWRNSQLAPDDRAMILLDRRTGLEADPVVVDATTGARADGDDHVFAAGPAAGPIMRRRYANGGATIR
ncbi:helix-turn-helix transcriptional regulator [Herbidospora galbida]|uniref:Helix-turn-helix transcriptional regulator n=1 Tax=Herbidospora galbida TaxID=2575442 RepID=A0A4U3MQL7_9ACTN|nr:helix-turn-helix transcriptional regulator [Herbidospora galbida]